MHRCAKCWYNSLTLDGSISSLRRNTVTWITRKKFGEINNIIIFVAVYLALDSVKLASLTVNLRVISFGVRWKEYSLYLNNEWYFSEKLFTTKSEMYFQIYACRNLAHCSIHCILLKQILCLIDSRIKPYQLRFFPAGDTNNCNWIGLTNAYFSYIQHEPKATCQAIISIYVDSSSYGYPSSFQLYHLFDDTRYNRRLVLNKTGRGGKLVNACWTVCSVYLRISKIDEVITLIEPWTPVSRGWLTSSSGHSVIENISERFFSPAFPATPVNSPRSRRIARGRVFQKWDFKFIVFTWAGAFCSSRWCVSRRDNGSSGTIPSAPRPGICLAAGKRANRRIQRWTRMRSFR